MKPITMTFLTRDGAEIHWTDKWNYRPSGKLQWLQKMCWNILYRLRAVTQVFDLTPHYTQVRIDPNQLMTSLIREADYQLRKNNYRPSTVLMGPQELARLTNEVDGRLMSYHTEPITFSLDATQTLYGLKIEVIPWMEGILVK